MKVRVVVWVGRRKEGSRGGASLSLSLSPPGPVAVQSSRAAVLPYSVPGLLYVQ